MSTGACQRLQPQFEPWLVEPRGILFNITRTTVSLPFASICSSTLPMASNSAVQKNSNVEITNARGNDFRNDANMNKSSKEGCFGGWSFLQALTNMTQNGIIDNDKVYVHPLAKRSASVLSEKSLEMCTESLGSETGSSISENEDDLISSFSTLDELEKSSRIPCYNAKKRSNNIDNFPPPLTTIRKGSEEVRVKSVREDGRLVIKAISVETPSCFRAERKGGRLQLHFIHNSELCNESNHDLVQGDNQGDD